MSDIGKLMRKYRKNWKDAEVIERGMLPKGRYQLRLLPLAEGCSPIMIDSDNVIRARVLLEVVAGPERNLVNRKTTKAWNLFTAKGKPDKKGFSILKSDLNALAIDVEAVELEQIGETIASLSQCVIDSNIVNRTDEDGIERQNIYFNALVSVSKAVRKK